MQLIIQNEDQRYDLKSRRRRDRVQDHDDDAAIQKDAGAFAGSKRGGGLRHARQSWGRRAAAGESQSAPDSSGTATGFHFNGAPFVLSNKTHNIYVMS